MIMKVKIGLVQMKMSEDLQENLAKAISGINEAAKKGANIVVLPEIFTSPYFPQEEKFDAKKYAEQIPGKTTAALSKAAKDNSVVLLGGSIFEEDSGKYYNTTPLLDETGKLLGKYRKMHIPHDPNFFEQNYFEKGDLGYQVFETRYGKLGTLICYDQWFPEAARINALMGADILFYPTAIANVKGIEQTEGKWQEAWENAMRGHAISNSRIVVAVNRVGTEKSAHFWGGSFVCDAFGKTLLRMDDREGVAVVECDLEHSKFVREGWRFFYNRRPETYGFLTK